jgi:translation initiation factor 1 (eIF-1/SUI1)
MIKNCKSEVLKQNNTNRTVDFTEIELINNEFDLKNNDGLATLLGKKIVVSVKSGKGKSKITQIEGLLQQHNLDSLLKKFKVLLSCGGHIAKFKDAITGKVTSNVMVLNGNFSTEVTNLLVKEGLADSDAILIHGV